MARIGGCLRGFLYLSECYLPKFHRFVAAIYRPFVPPPGARVGGLTPRPPDLSGRTGASRRSRHRTASHAKRGPKGGAATPGRGRHAMPSHVCLRGLSSPGHSATPRARRGRFPGRWRGNGGGSRGSVAWPPSGQERRDSAQGAAPVGTSQRRPCPAGMTRPWPGAPPCPGLQPAFLIPKMRALARGSLSKSEASCSVIAPAS